MMATCTHMKGGQVDLIKMAASFEDLQASLRLAHDAYSRRGLADKNAYRMRVTPYHLLPSTEVILGRHSGQPACTLTLVPDAEFGLPMEEAFESEIAPLRRRFRCVEGSCLACRGGDAASSFPVVARLMSFSIQCAAQRGFDCFLVAVHPHHAAFYSKYFGGQILCDGERPYQAANGHPAVALSLDLRRLNQLEARVRKRIFSRRYSVAQLAQRPVSYAVLDKLAAIYEETHAEAPFAFGKLFGEAAESGLYNGDDCVMAV